MHTILIISKDQSFARMLELELLSAGYAVSKDKDPRDILGVGALIRSIRLDETAQPKLLVLDADICAGSSLDDLREVFFSLSCLDMKAILFASEELSPALRDAFFPGIHRVFVRPFSMREFLFEVSRITGDGKPIVGISAAKEPYNAADDLRLIPDERKITFRGKTLPLTPREYDLLAYLLKRRGYTVTRGELEGAVWGKDAKTNIADVYIRYLRQKIEEPYHVKLIYTVRGVGYMIRL